MNVALPDELERRVNESVERGEFANRNEFFKRAAELLLRQRFDSLAEFGLTPDAALRYKP